MAKTTKREKLVVGNWKMNPQTTEDARKIFKRIKKAADSIKGVNVAICPSFSHIYPLNKIAGGIFIGAQDVFWEEAGSFTGEVSASMLRDLGCTYVIVGHSERRAMGETSEMITKKVKEAVEKNLKVILCIGEKVRDENGDYLEFLKNQLTESLSKVQKRYLSNIVIAYEPVWAIGKSFNNAMVGKDMQEISIFIKKVLADIYGKDETSKNLILYGGSVAPINARDIIESGQVDGFLVGRQSLEPINFGEIIKIVSTAK
ncbi:MAG: triose-phosphate isomerase [Candidatus Paceibacterota bacterium]